MSGLSGSNVTDVTQPSRGRAARPDRRRRALERAADRQDVAAMRAGDHPVGILRRDRDRADESAVGHERAGLRPLVRAVRRSIEILAADPQALRVRRIHHERRDEQVVRLGSEHVRSNRVEAARDRRERRGRRWSISPSRPTASPRRASADCRDRSRHSRRRRRRCRASRRIRQHRSRAPFRCPARRRSSARHPGTAAP